MTQNTPSHRISRHDFIKVTTAAIGGFIGLAYSVPAIGYLLSPAFRENKATGWIDLGPLENYPIGATPSFFDFTLTSVNGWERTAINHGVFVVRQDDKSVQVLSNICTHLGCRVKWHPDLEHYVSPCHNGHFDLQGSVVSGPPPRPLDEFTTKIENGNLFIQLPPYKRIS
jgi:menaquinol-cytochrome c reductase iron-sulfur subunit